MAMVRNWFCRALIIGCVLLSGCSQLPRASLYQQIGGEQGSEQLVDAFIQQIGNDPQILPYFEKASVAHFRAGFLAHLCAVLDGPCAYRGDSMEQIHRGMNINERDFNRVVELLIAAMNETQMPVTLQNRVLARLAPMRGEIIHL
ncbi:Cyanoglobin; Hemoglobin-like protein HbN [Pseudoalteromonas luteoviolacea B = ATCC 29581]|nr:Cyanoglobin; Hemoglobin-like protein HbN [Pseudoalteromonas luteoviolacea B = ATCC 29581]